MGPEAVKLLASHSVNLEPSGGIPEVTAEDIAHALGTLKHKYASLVIRVKYADQKELGRDLFVSLYTCMMESGAKDWIRPRPHWVYEMCHTALNEFLAPALCPECNGLGEFLHKSLKITCESCLGTGKFRPVDPAIILKVRNWKPWDGQYRQIMGKLALWEDIAVGALNKLDRMRIDKVL